MIRACLALLAAGIACAQPRFDVASIRPGRPDQPKSGVTTGKGQLRIENETLKRCLMGAYSVGPNQILGGPPWVETDLFVIHAQAEDPIDDDAVIMVMLQNLLKDRFRLEAHRESRTIRAYVLESGKAPKLQKSAGGESNTNWGRTRIDAKATTMDHVAEVLSRQLDFPVVNQTGIEGVFDVKLEWSNAEAGPSIFTAIQEQLGLRLTSRKAPVNIIVIDHVEKPTENE